MHGGLCLDNHTLGSQFCIIPEPGVGPGQQGGDGVPGLYPAGTGQGHQTIQATLLENCLINK